MQTGKKKVKLQGRVRGTFGLPDQALRFLASFWIAWSAGWASFLRLTSLPYRPWPSLGRQRHGRQWSEFRQSLPVSTSLCVFPRSFSY